MIINLLNKQLFPNLWMKPSSPQLPGVHTTAVTAELWTWQFIFCAYRQIMLRGTEIKTDMTEDEFARVLMYSL